MARTASILTLARKLEAARASLAAAVVAKQRELDEVDAALRRVVGGGGGGGRTARTTRNGRVGRPTGRRGRRGGRRGRKAGGAPGAGTLGAHVLAAVSKAGKTVGIADVAKSIKAAGYKTSAKANTQAVMIGQTLGRLARGGHIAKRGRGAYASK